MQSRTRLLHSTNHQRWLLGDLPKTPAIGAFALNFLSSLNGGRIKRRIVMGFLSHLFKHREAGDASPVGEGCAGKTEIPPQITGTMRLELGDVLSRVPEQFVRAGEHDLRQKLSFDAKTVAASMARGRVEVPLPVISEQCPSVFFLSAHAASEVLIRLPLQKLVEQLGTPPEPSEVSGEPSEVTQGGIKVIQAGLPVSHEGLPLAEAGLPVSHEGLLLAQAGLPVSHEGLPLAQAGLPVSHEGLPLLHEGSSVVPQVSETTTPTEINPNDTSAESHQETAQHPPCLPPPQTQIPPRVTEEPREIPVEGHDAPKAPLPLDGYLGEDAHFQVTVAASAGIPFLASLRPAVLGATIPAPEIPAAHAAPPEGIVAVRPLGIQPPSVKPIIFPPRPASSVSQIAPSAPATPLPVTESVVRKSGERYAALRPIFMTDDSLDLAAIARHCAALPGVKACVLRVGTDEEKSGEFSDGDDSISHIQTIRAGDVILRLLLSPRGFIPGVRERLAQAVETIVICES